MGIFARWRNRNMTAEQLAAKIQAVYSDVDKWEGLFATANQVEKLVKNAPKAVREAPEVVLSIFRNKPSDLKSVYYYIRDKEAIDALVAEPDSMHIICGEWGIVHKESYTEDLIQKLMEKDLNAFKKEFTHLDLLTEKHAKWLVARGDADVGALELNEHVYLATLRMKLKADGFEIPAEQAELINFARKNLEPDDFREFRGKLSAEREYWSPSAYLSELERRLGESGEGLEARRDLEDKIAVQRKSLEKPSKKIKMVKVKFETEMGNGDKLQCTMRKSAGGERVFTDRELQLIMSDEHLFNSLNEMDKFGFIQSLGKYMSGEMGMECPEIGLNATPMIELLCSAICFDDKNLVLLSKKLLADLGNLTSFLAHEIRHEWQKDKDYTYSDGTKKSFGHGPNQESYRMEVSVRSRVSKCNGRPFKLGYLTTPAEVDARRYAREFCERHGVAIGFKSFHSRADECLLRELAGTFVKEGGEAFVFPKYDEPIPSDKEAYLEVQKNAREFYEVYSAEIGTERAFSARRTLGAVAGSGGCGNVKIGEQPKIDGP